MSIVGPRPHALAHDNEYTNLIANYSRRHHVKPGITGWAQANGFRGGTPELAMMQRRVEIGPSVYRELEPRIGRLDHRTHMLRIASSEECV